MRRILLAQKKQTQIPREPQAPAPTHLTPTNRSRKLTRMKHLIALLLTLACLLAGYGFYKMNDGDIINSVCFTIGILGILLSFLRQKSST